MPGIAFVIATILLAALIAAVAQYIFKRTLKEFKFNVSGIYHVLKNKMILFGLFLYVVSLVIYLFALKYTPLSFAYPTFASAFIFIAVISKFYLNERIGMLRALGIGLVVIGICVIAFTF